MGFPSLYMFRGMTALSGSSEQMTSGSLPTLKSYDLPGSLELTHNEASSNSLSLASISLSIKIFVAKYLLYTISKNGHISITKNDPDV